jgi:prepilin-type N-terminal cleavage/methylation domain-containing protein
MDGFRRFRRKNLNSLGFTLLELMIVVAIIGILAGIGIPSYRNYLHKAKVVTAVAEIKMIMTHIEAYRSNRYELPVDLSAVGYQNFRDPWGNPYQYLNLEAGGGASLGPSFASAKKGAKVIATEKRHPQGWSAAKANGFYAAKGAFQKKFAKSFRETIKSGRVKTISQKPDVTTVDYAGRHGLMKAYSPTYHKGIMPVGLPLTEDGLLLLAKGKGGKGGGDTGSGDTGGGDTSGGDTGGGSTSGSSTGGGDTGGGSTGGGGTDGGSTGGDGSTGVYGGGPGKGKQTAKGLRLNNDFDLYSMGRDGKSHWKMTQKHSQDDIIRGNSGSFVGPVDRY